MKLSHLLVLSTALVFTGAIAQQAVAPANPETVPVVAVDTGPVKPGDPKAGQAKAGACAACPRWISRPRRDMAFAVAAKGGRRWN